MTILVFLPAVLLLIIVAASYYRNREAVLEMARSLQNQKAFGVEETLSPRDAITPTPDDSLEEFDGATLHEVLGELSEYVKSLKPDWIVGVHPGGRLLSVYVANEISFPKTQCLFVRTDPDRTGTIEFEPKNDLQNQPVRGRMVVIDDISRTGNTLSSIKWFLMRSNYVRDFSLTEVYFAVLLVVSEKGESRSRFRPDWVYFRTDRKFFRLPWSELSVRITAAFAEKRHGLENYDREAIELHERIISDYEFALELAKGYVSRAPRVRERVTELA